MQIFIGVDPGKKGAYAIMSVADGENVYMEVKPWDDQRFADDMRYIAVKNSQDRVLCTVEDVHSLPHEGVKSAHSFGKSCGYIEGVLRALQIPYQTVIPQKWKKEWSLTNDKKQSIETCKKLYPSLSLRASERCRTDSDDLAEAALIATWGKRHF